jgi:hypothetical protein
MSVVEVLNHLGKGGAIEEMRDELSATCKAVAATKKAGSVTLTINIKPNADMVQLEPVVKSSIPKEGHALVNLYVTDGGELSTSDPSQPTFGELE